MTYGQIRDFTLKLINQYSIAGSPIPDSYNNQADYVLHIPQLLDDAQMYVATNQGRIRTVVPMTALDSHEEDGWTVYRLPEDCWQVCSSGLLRLHKGEVQRYHRYHQVGDRSIMVPSSLEGVLQLEYFRYPALLGADPSPEMELDNTPVAQMALPYYVAAHLVMHDDSFAYQALYNEFENKLSRLVEAPQAELSSVEDVYDTAAWGCAGE